jgi:hypothetical protein
VPDSSLAPYLHKSNLSSNGKLLRGKSVAELTTPDMSTLTKCRAERRLLSSSLEL